MTWALRLVLTAALLAGGGFITGAKGRQQPFPRGLYGNVEISGETGDLGGLEVRFFTDPETGKPMAEFVVCEGWCNETHISEVTRIDVGFAFSQIDTLGTGDKTMPEAEHLTEYRLIPSGRGWKVLYLYDGVDISEGETFRIKPLKQPFGLEIVRTNSAVTDDEL